MPITVPQYTLTAQEEAGLLHAQGIYNAEQLAKVPVGQTKTPLAYFAMISRSWLASYRRAKIQADADAAAAAVVAANPPE